MKAEIVAKIAVWFIIFVALLTLGLGMMSTPNSVENVLGFLLIVVIFYLSIKTKCLTTIKFKRDEKYIDSRDIVPICNALSNIVHGEGRCRL